jgi:hypothetical protein
MYRTRGRGAAGGTRGRSARKSLQGRPRGALGEGGRAAERAAARRRGRAGGARPPAAATAARGARRARGRRERRGARLPAGGAPTRPCHPSARAGLGVLGRRPPRGDPKAARQRALGLSREGAARVAWGRGAGRAPMPLVGRALWAGAAPRRRRPAAVPPGRTGGRAWGRRRGAERGRRGRGQIKSLVGRSGEGELCGRPRGRRRRRAHEQRGARRPARPGANVYRRVGGGAAPAGRCGGAARRGARGLCWGGGLLGSLALAEAIVGGAPVPRPRALRGVRAGGHFRRGSGEAAAPAPPGARAAPRARRRRRRRRRQGEGARRGPFWGAWGAWGSLQRIHMFAHEGPAGGWARRAVPGWGAARPHACAHAAAAVGLRGARARPSSQAPQLPARPAGWPVIRWERGSGGGRAPRGARAAARRRPGYCLAGGAGAAARRRGAHPGPRWGRRDNQWGVGWGGGVERDSRGKKIGACFQAGKGGRRRSAPCSGAAVCTQGGTGHKGGARHARARGGPAPAGRGGLV